MDETFILLALLVQVVYVVFVISTHKKSDTRDDQPVGYHFLSN